MKINPAAEMAKLRWKGINKKDRSAEMSKVSKARWNKKKKKVQAHALTNVKAVS